MFNPLDLPKLFKRARPSEHHEEEGRQPEGRVELGEEVLLGPLAAEGSVCGTAAQDVPQGLRILAWTSEQLLAFEYANELRHLYTVDARGVLGARWVDDDIYVVEFEEHFEVYRLQAVNADSDTVQDGSPLAKTNFQPQLLHRLLASEHEAYSIISSSEILITASQPDEGVLYLTSAYGRKCEKKELWRAPTPFQAPAASALLPLDNDTVVLGYSDGRLSRHSLSGLCRGSSPQVTANAALPGRIMGLHVVRHPRTQEALIVGGGDDGSIGLWSADTLTLRARWTMFLTPLTCVIQLPDTNNTPLRGCTLCVAVDGTIAVVAVDALEMVYMIPGSVAELRSICLQANKLMLLYADGRARVWDTATRELWRTVGQDKASEMLQHGGGQRIRMRRMIWVRSLWNLKLILISTYFIRSGSVLLLDLQRYVTESGTIAKAISTNRAQTQSILATMDQLRLLLGALVTVGLNEGIDTICLQRLGAPSSVAHAGLSSEGCTVVYSGDNARAPWCVSPEVSANRALAVVVVLRALSVFEEFADGAATVITFYATSLGACVGPAFCSPSLPFLAQRWLEGSSEVRHAARVLFDASAVRMTDEEAGSMVDRWQHQLPCLQPPPEQEATSSAMALFICGYLAAEKYAVMSTHVLTDISKSVALYLHNEQSAHRVLAIELCTYGFHVWQHYVDAMEVLRALFQLATTAKKDAISAQNPGAHARAALLAIAAAATPLFMTTLSLDVLSPSTAAHRRSVMQVVAFLLRKRPLVLLPSLPRLMEAVVRSLDPNATASRELVLDTATEIIRQVVKTYPTVDFHGGTQRLAVGTSEGAVVMYDLKTAIRLYVLEGHKRRISACSFSPDGRRLLTLSLEERTVLVWKVGSSFASFFNPGAPPRQGHGGSEPFKTFPFNVGEEAEMSVTETFDLIKFEWTGDRSVRVKIRQSVLTLST
ncbi:WD40-repeat-containing domain protein [Schizophyllum fasciatum]